MIREALVPSKPSRGLRPWEMRQPKEGEEDKYELYSFIPSIKQDYRPK